MKPWMQKSGIGLSGRIPVTTERKKSVAGNSATEGPAMSTDSPIPERWRSHYEAVVSNLAWKTSAGKMGHTQEIKKHLIEELGTAESLVRDLAGVLNLCHPFVPFSLQDEICTALSRIPAHLRAPETTSTGESSTVLRKEDL